MRILASRLPSTLQQQRWKKKTWTNHSLLFNASAVCWIMSCHLFRHHPGADSARAQVRAEQHTLISVFKLNSCKLCQFKHKSQRMLARARSEKICACAYQKCANPRLRTRAKIKLSLKYCVWMDKFTQKICQNARLGKYPIADIAGWTYSISALDQCILLKWQHFLNINQKATTKKSLTALDLIAFLTLIKINL